MEYIPRTPFRRPFTAALAQATQRPAPPTPPCTADKWDVLRDLTEARGEFGIGHRQLAVLQALLSFLPGREIPASAPDAVVFAANRTLSDRLNGMPDSTLRRHLALLTDAGLIARRDSPNGKRYVRRSASGDVLRAFGFDLSPLLALAQSLKQRARIARQNAMALKALRETVSLMRRDVAALKAHLDGSLPPDFCIALDCVLEESRIALRRKAVPEDLTTLHDRLQACLVHLEGRIADIYPVESAETSTSPAENERHIQRSNKNIDEDDAIDARKEEERTTEAVTPSRALPPGLILDACKEVRVFHSGPLRSWRDLSVAAESIAPMIGVTARVWAEAKRAMGAESAITSLFCILERFSSIRNPSGYLKTLSDKAAQGRFSPTPMVMALLAA